MKSSCILDLGPSIGANYVPWTYFLILLESLYTIWNYCMTYNKTSFSTDWNEVLDEMRAIIRAKLMMIKVPELRSIWIPTPWKLRLSPFCTLHVTVLSRKTRKNGLNHENFDFIKNITCLVSFNRSRMQFLS